MFCPGGAAAARLRQRANGGVPDRCARWKPEEPRACKVKRVGEAVFLPPFLVSKWASDGLVHTQQPCAELCRWKRGIRGTLVATMRAHSTSFVSSRPQGRLKGKVGK